MDFAAAVVSLSRSPRGRRWTAFAALAALLLIAMPWGAGEVAGGRARADLARQASTAAVLRAAVLRAELEKHRSLPFVLAEDSDLRAALARPTPTALRALDDKLEGLSGRTRAAVIYLLNRRGLTLAASNWRRPDSFVGSNYSFRPYFSGAMTDGSAEHFALGTVSRHPGLFLARRVDGPDGPLGVVVVKVEFDGLEHEWRQSEDPAFVADQDGVVLITSVPAWRFATVKPLSRGRRAALRQGMQFGGAALEPLPIVRGGRIPTGEASVRLPEATEVRRFVEATAPAPSAGWKLHILTAAKPVMEAQASARIAGLSLAAFAVLGAGVLLRRREQAEARTAQRDAARIELEHRVDERTAELKQANRKLTREMEERRRAEAGLQTLQDELVQANKLSMLGQIAAGVAHEINQPVAAIRTYADNAARQLARERPDAAGDSLTAIAALTERIGVITDELRAFSRKTKGEPKPVAVEAVIGGALMLMGARLRQQQVSVERVGETEDLLVFAERVRLEQVLVNLLQNALDALLARPQGRIVLSVRAGPKRVTIRVADNGPGLSPEAAAGLFTPFVSTKPAGVGLGLVISNDIVTEFGGSLKLEPSGPGAVFVVTLKRAY